MTKKALLLINPHARKGKKSLAQAMDILKDLDFELLTVPLEEIQNFSEAIRNYGEDVDVVIVGGGDGTLNSVVDSLLEIKRPLGVLPLGTANDLARTLSIPLSLREACEVIATGVVKHIDLGCVNGKYFFNVASLGLSVKITQNLSHQIKRNWGIFAYALTAFQALSHTRPFPAEIRLSEGESIQVTTIQLAVGNGRYYGGGMAVVDDAAIDDQRLDLYSLEIERWWQIFPLLWTLPKGRQYLLPWVRMIQGEIIEIHTDKSYTVNTDGELTVSTPATFRVVPKILPILTPRANKKSF